MNEVRLIYWALVIALGIASVLELSSGTPTATKTLPINHKIQPGDLETNAIAALNNYYVRRLATARQKVTRDMVSDAPGPAVIESGFAVIVNLERKAADDLHLQEGELVQIRSGKQDLGKPGPLRALTCDEARCTAVIGFDQAPNFDPKLLRGSELARPPPPIPPAGD
ncbi:MAG TPA: hypothetical protein VE650_05420 [Acetobacteraceae bacterium]|nr:hypothetical protein [Acetobacteraceae bacterium]